MPAFVFDDLDAAVPADVSAALRVAWDRIAGAGSWWTGAQRVAIAEAARAARRLRSEPPWLRGEPAEPEAGAPLDAFTLDTVRRIAIDAHRLDRAWCDGVVARLGDAAYVELAAVVVFATVADAFAESLGVAPEPLPAPRPGEPDRVRPDSLGEAGAWIELTVPWQGPNVARALSQAPADMLAFMQLVGSMYAVADFGKLVWEGGALSRPQVELVAARVSAVNECFY